MSKVTASKNSARPAITYAIENLGSGRMAKLEEIINKLSAKLVAPTFGIMMLIIVLSLVPPIYDTVQLFMGSYNTCSGVESFASSASSVSSAAGR